MRVPCAAFLAAILCSFSSLGQAPNSPSPPATQDAAPAPVQETAPAPAADVPTFASLLRRPLDTVDSTLANLNTGRWKRGSVREEAEANIGDIRRDLHDSLPPVLAAAEANPGSLTKVLPLSRHVDLLYDVLLRVVEAGRLLGSSDDATQLQQGLIDLGAARRALNQRLMDLAAAQEKQIGDLKAELQTQIAAAARAAHPPAPPPAPAAAAAPAKKPKKKTTPAKPGQTKPVPGTPAPAKPASQSPTGTPVKPSS